MTTTSDVGSISSCVLDLNSNKPSEQETSEAQDNPFYDNWMENYASAGTSLPPINGDCNEYYGDISATISSSYTTYTVPTKRELIPIGVGLYFDTVNDAHIWYKNYAKSVGFTMRKNELRLDGKCGEVASQWWICSRQGYRLKKWMEKTDRAREPKGITRNRCKAEL